MISEQTLRDSILNCENIVDMAQFTVRYQTNNPTSKDIKSKTFYEFDFGEKQNEILELMKDIGLDGKCDEEQKIQVEEAAKSVVKTSKIKVAQ